MHRLMFLALCAVTLGGCTSGRVSRYDEFEKARVDRTVANDVSGRVFERTIVCLNAMRETRRGALTTNQTVSWFTNLAVVSVTNLTVTRSANQQVGLTTNAVPLPDPLPALRSEPGGETNEAPVFAAGLPGPSTTGGLTISTSASESSAAGPNQTVTTGLAQTVTSVNAQSTTTSQNLAITRGTNSTVTVETNYVITTFTNVTLTPLTNSVVEGDDGPASDYYLFTEFTPPQDFVLAPGESLVLLVDGARHGLTASTPHTSWANRRGFVTTFYKVAPDVLVQIANAEEVKLRIKGTNGVIERRMSKGSRAAIRDFLLQYFATPPSTPGAVAGKSPRRAS